MKVSYRFLLEPEEQVQKLRLLRLKRQRLKKRGFKNHLEEEDKSLAPSEKP